MDKYQNKYRIPSARANWWNYGWAGAYFITICTKNRNHYFGRIEQGKMNLSNCGILADVFWYEIKNHAKNIELGAFVVMPNHIHGILILNDFDSLDHNELAIDNEMGMDNELGMDNEMGMDNVQTRHALSLADSINMDSINMDSNNMDSNNMNSNKMNPDNNMNSNNMNSNNNMNSDNNINSGNKSESEKRFRNPGKNTISSIIGGYKSAVTKHAHRLGIEFEWQSRFHDHIIRNDAEYQRINDYIENNPLKWNDDKFYKNE